MEEYQEYNSALMLWKIIPPFLIVLGTTGNIFAMIVLLQKRIRNTPTSMFLTCLAVSDILALITALLRYWIKYTFDVDVREDLTEFGCKFHWFVVYVVTQFSSWMLICVTVERVISTYMPHNRQLLYKMKFARIAVMVILSSLIVLNSHYLFGYGDVYRYQNNETVLERCRPKSESYRHFDTYIWTWIDLCVLYLIPTLVLLIGNSFISYKVLESYRRCRQPNNNRSISTQQNKPWSLTVLLLLVSGLFIVCTMPIVIYPIGEPYWKKDGSDHQMAKLFLSETVANLLLYFNHSVNFVLYFLSGSKFRNEVKRLICRNATFVAHTEQQTTLF